MKELEKYVSEKRKKYGDYSTAEGDFYYSDCNLYTRSANDIVMWNRKYSQDELCKLDKDMEMILIKLNYEKDFDNVKKLLSEYGIEV